MTISEELVTNSVISLSELFPSSTDQFIKPFEKVIDPDIHNGMYLDFELGDREQKNKINPVLRLASPSDAEAIVGIYKELYNGTYPYKEMEDVDEVRKMIQDPSIQWIIYQDPSFNIAGCITFVLDFDNKRGYIRGFMLKKKYQGHIDITKAMIGSMIGMIHKFKNEIYVWYVENRTAHSKSQYSMYVCGIAPIGFYPNKDVFLGKVESDLMQILYDEKALNDFRTNKIPRILPEAENCYLYSDKRYKLGDYHIEDPRISLNQKKIFHTKKHLIKSIKKDRYGYEKIRFSIPGTHSFFEFLYTPQVQNFEKTKYKVNNLEELYVFVQEFIECRKELGVRYCEAFLSAYKVEHQKIFYNAGLSPRGYVPSWVYNKNKKVFEDNILFNWFDGRIFNDIQLVDEGKDLVQVLSLDNREVIEGSFETIEKFPIFYTVKEKVSNVWNYPKVIKTTLLTGLMVYLFMLIGSIVFANFFGYNIISHTISQLGTIKTTPMPSIFNSSCFIGGPITMLLYCYLSRRVRFSSQKINKVRFMYKLHRYSVIIGVIGSFGYIFVGVFSLDRKGPQGIFHCIASFIAFGGFVIALFTFGLVIFCYNSEVPKIIGINGIVPLITLVLNCIIPTPLLEWMLLFSILTTIIPLVFWLSLR